MCRSRSILIIILLIFAMCCKNKIVAQSLKFFEKDSSLITGNWTGSSLCQAKNSSCQDETVQYNILQGDSGVYHVSMSKIVKGKTNFMGMLECTYDESTKTLSSNENGKIWQFTMKHATIDGILIWRTQLYRKIHLEKNEH